MSTCEMAFLANGTSARGVRREKAMLFQRVQAPPGEVLPPEAVLLQ
jgi:hypothetical protein